MKLLPLVFPSAVPPDNTPVPGEEIAELTKTIGVSILCIFLLEQVLRVVAFGPKEFCSHFWFVADLVVVLVSLLCETVLEGHDKWFPKMGLIMRLWMVVAFVFDVCLLNHEQSEREEALEEQEEEEESGKEKKDL